MLLNIEKKYDEFISKYKNTLLKIDNYDFSLKLTVFFILLHFSSQFENWILVPAFILSAMGLLFDKLRDSKTFWIIQLLSYSSWCFIYWYSIDNHMYLWGYWIIAILISIFTKKKEFLAISGQYLIAFCMFYAVLQKILSSTYLSGDFFYFTLLTDMRFSFIGKLIQYDLRSVISQNLMTLDMMKSNTENYFLTAGPFILKPISFFLTWYTIIIEFIVSILFFLKKKNVYFWQHSSLLTFSTLYFVLPIKGFAASLLLFGFINIKKDDLFFKSLYLAFIFYIFIISVLVKDLIFSTF